MADRVRRTRKGQRQRLPTFEFINPSEKFCLSCAACLPLAAFAASKRAKDGLQTYCRGCLSQKTREKIHYRRKLIAAYKLERGCQDCGFSQFAEALDFDHVRGIKEFSISDGLSSKAWVNIVAELDKCELVCANCHRHRTWLRGGGGASGRRESNSTDKPWSKDEVA